MRTGGVTRATVPTIPTNLCQRSVEPQLWHVLGAAFGLALGRLRDAFDSLPDAIYRAKGFLYLDDVPRQKILLQMVGRRSRLNAAGAWGRDVPTTRIVMIGACDAFNAAAPQSALDACVADPAVEGSPLKKLVATCAEKELREVRHA